MATETETLEINPKGKVMTALEMSEQLAQGAPSIPEGDDFGIAEYRARRKEVYEQIVEEAARKVEKRLSEEDERRVENRRMDDAPLVKLPSKPVLKIRGIRI